MGEHAAWLLDQRSDLTAPQLDELDRELAGEGPATRSAPSRTPTLAVSLHDVVIHDNRKWFGEADVRLDALVITGHGRPEDPSSYYMPHTASFARVKDADRLQLGAGGMLAFHGPAVHFLDLLIMVSRETGDSDDLATILGAAAQSGEMTGGVGALLGLAVAAPEVAVVTAALGAAGALGDLAYRLLRRATGSTIGLYRNSHLQFRDGFGIGLHPGPAPQSFHVNDLSFRYEIVLEEA